MAVDTYKLCLNNITQGGTVCKNPNIRWETPACNAINCELVEGENCIRVQIDDTCDDRCFYVLVDCDDCDECPTQRHKICVCEGPEDCDDCENCVNNICTSTCPDGQFCVNNSCVDCQNIDDCPCNQVCDNGDCKCPADKPFKDDRGCCSDCQTDSDCDPCFRCTGDGCVPVVCPSGVCDPTTNECVECINSGHCTAPNECCVDNDCVCCDGYFRNPATGLCELDPECERDEDCPECKTCLNGECVDIICPDGYECDGGECKKPCECGDPTPCKSIENCVDRSDDGDCFCEDCEPTPCQSNQECEEGCICSEQKICQKNPCYGTCNESGDCGDGCGCYEGECVPCNTLPCEPDCEIADGCDCIDGTCTDGPSQCDEENVSLIWEKVAGEVGTVINPGLPALNGTCNITPLGIVNASGGNNPLGFYYEHQFNFEISNGSGGTFYYSPSAGVEIPFGNGTSAALSQSQAPVNNNVFGFRVKYVDSDGRQYIWELVFDQTDLQAPNTWDCRVASATGIPATTSGGTAPYWVLKSTNSNFKFKSTMPINVETFSTGGNPISISFTSISDYVLQANISGCGEWVGDFVMLCGNKEVTITTPPFIIDEDSCCDPTKPGCEGGPGEPCEDETVNIDLKKFSYFDPSKSSFVVMVDMSSISFEQLYYMSNICWGSKTNSDGFNDILFGGSFGQSPSPLYVNVTFTNGGCVTFGQDCETRISLCEIGVGELCFDRCDDFESYVYDAGSRDLNTLLLKGYPSIDVSPSATYSWSGVPNQTITYLGRNALDVETISIDLVQLRDSFGITNFIVTLNVSDGDCEGEGQIIFSTPEPPCVPNPVDGATISYDCMSGIQLSDPEFVYFADGSVLNEGDKMAPGNYTVSISNDDGCSIDYSLNVPQCYRCNSQNNCVPSVTTNNMGYPSLQDCQDNCDSCTFRVINISFDNELTYCDDGNLQFSANSGVNGNTFNFEIQYDAKVVAPNENLPVGENAPVTFNLADLWVEGQSPAYTLIATDSDGCVKEYIFTIDCFVNPDCQEEEECFGSDFVEVGSLNNAGRITSLKVIDSSGSMTELLGTNITPSLTFDSYYDIADISTLNNHLRQYDSICSTNSNLVISWTLSGGNVDFQVVDSKLLFSTVTFEREDGLTVTVPMTPCNQSQLCGSAYIHTGLGEITQIDVNELNQVVGETTVCPPIAGQNNYGDIALSPDGALYGVVNDTIYRHDATNCSSSVDGTINQNSPSLVFLDSTNILYCYNSGGTLFVYKYNIITKSSTVWATISGGASYVPSGDLAIVGSTVYGTFKKSGSGSTNYLLSMTKDSGNNFVSYTEIGSFSPGLEIWGLFNVNGNLFGCDGFSRNILLINTTNPTNSSVVYTLTLSSNAITGASSIEDSGISC